MNDIYADPDREFRFPPDWAQPVLEWARPRFQSVFVLLHPFVKVPQGFEEYIEPDGARWLEGPGMAAFGSTTPSLVAWEAVRSAIGSPSLPALLADVSANSIGFFSGTATEDSVKHLLSYLRNNSILAPETHYLPSMLKSSIQCSLEKYGVGTAKWGGSTVEESPYERENLLYATPYECPYSFICCTNEELLRAITKEFNFDGFFAVESTLFDWKAGASHQRGCNAGAVGARVKI